MANERKMPFSRQHQVCQSKEGIKIIDGDLTACAFVDLDDFMLINDTHGSEIANKLL